MMPAKIKLVLHMGLAICCLLIVQPMSAQPNIPFRESGRSWMNYFNRFQYFVYTKPDRDSALSCIRELASDNNNASFLRFLLDNSFAQQFIPSGVTVTDTAGSEKAQRQRAFFNEILSGIMSDTTRLLLETARPIYLLSRIEDAGPRTSELRKLTAEFINTELVPGFFYKNKTGRFGLVIYRIISKRPGLRPLANELFGLIYSILRKNQISVTEASSGSELDERAWYRYLYAYANYVKAEAAENENTRGHFLKIASDFSPDLIDRVHQSAYFYDMFFLLGKEKATFTDDYIRFLTNSHANTEEVLSALSRAAFADPSYKAELKTFYNAHVRSGGNFDKYWMELVNSHAKIAPSIVLKELDGKMFSSRKLLGRWILVDFWGTWCAPCRKEDPDVQKFYNSFVLLRPHHIALLTIACKCTYSDVSRYMKKNHYSFPVAMSNGRIDDEYSVVSYPTKILITPEGRYLEIPFIPEWVNFIKEYTDL